MIKYKYCTNCKHFRKDYALGFLWIPIVGWIVVFLNFVTKSHILYGKCGAAPKNGDALLSPGFKEELYYASVERRFGCGPEAKNYEEKEKCTNILTSMFKKISQKLSKN